MACIKKIKWQVYKYTKKRKKSDTGANKGQIVKTALKNRKII